MRTMSKEANTASMNAITDHEKLANAAFVERTRNALFNSPPIPPESLTPEQKEKYAKAGEQLYGGMDFENIEKSMCEGITYIVMQLKSGMHPDYLEQHDKDAMESVYGPEWRAKFWTDLTLES